VCQELRCGKPTTEPPFNAGTDERPLLYWLCAEHREQVRHDRWSAQTGGVLFIGADAVLDTPKHVKRLNSLRASDWTQINDAGENSAFVEMDVTLGYAEGPEHDEDRTILIPTDLAEIMGEVLPSLAADAKRRIDPGNGPVVVYGDD
jgi:hypothetical protein